MAAAAALVDPLQQVFRLPRARWARARQVFQELVDTAMEQAVAAELAARVPARTTATAGTVWRVE